MKYGVAAGPDMARIAADAGYDYFEWGVEALLRPREDDAAFRAALAKAEAAPIPCRALNGFIPGDLKITGPDANMPALEEYVTTACRRAQEAGVATIVFGSGGARQVPDGFDHARATEQIVEFCRMLGPVALHSRVTIAVEPLNKGDCNILTTVRETARVVEEVDSPAIRLLVDSYHWARDNDSVEDIVRYGHLLAHVHIATFPTRVPPGAEEYDFNPFFGALKQGSYDGRISLEGGFPNLAEDLPRALALMRDFTA